MSAGEQRTRRALAPLVACALGMVATWFVILTMTVPRPITGAVGDYGFFVGVADRLRAGDTLYADIWDNKDPLYFYTLAVANMAGAVGAWVLELGWVILGAISVYGMSRAVGLTRISSVSLGGIAAPLILVGMPYFMGNTHLPGVVVSTLAIATALNRRWMITGVLLATLGILKLILLPTALIAIVTILVLRRDAKAARRMGLAGLSTALILMGVLLIRGELTGFLATQIDNLRHAQAPIVSAEQNTAFYKVAQHLVILVNPHVVMIGLATSAIIAAAFLLARRRAVEEPQERDLRWLVLTAFVAAGLTIAVSGKWFHHAQAFEISSLAAIVLLYRTLRTFRPRRVWVAVLITALATYLLMGAPPIRTYLDQIKSAPGQWAIAQEPDPLTILLRERPPTTVSFVGFGNAVPRSGGLEKWDLVCRHIGQRPFHPTWMFDEMRDCLPGSETIVVTNDYGRDPAFPSYSAFVESVESLLAAHYTCLEDGDFRICTRR